MTDREILTRLLQVIADNCHHERYGLASIRRTANELLRELEPPAEPPETSDEAFRGGEAAGYLAEQQYAAQRLK